ncbi:hypothetical protein EJ07DRAFT_171100 [Lizonia empirigonia]|nr:hypothetical protein EJ07DRAFT_171100 [Lizonia empirigonia]
MPVDWKPDMPIGVFIRNHHHTKQAKKFKGRVFNDQGQAWEQKRRTRDNSGRDPHDIEGVLAVQKSFFLKLAGQDNGAKGLSPSNATGSEDLDKLLADTVQTVQEAWTKGR